MTEQEKIDALMLPRVCIRARWPGCSKFLQVGDILQKAKISRYYRKQTSLWFVYLAEFEVKENLHLINELQWWQHRNINELPSYVKFIHGNEIVKVHQYSNYNSCYFSYYEDGILGGDLYHTLPATEAQYLEYQKLLNAKKTTKK